MEFRHLGVTNRVGGVLLVALAMILGSGSVQAQTVAPAFAANYSLTSLGSVPGVSTPYGGLTFLLGNPNTLLIGGAANGGSGTVFSIGVIRDANHHITGFSGTATVFASAANIDGGLAFGPSNVLFYTRYPSNELGQIKPSSTMTDKVVDLSALGVTSSVGSLNFVPPGLPGAGDLKVVSYDSGDWYTLSLASDGSGTYNATATYNTTITGGPEGFIYVPHGSPQFSGNNLLLSDYSDGQVSAYQVDSNGDPTGSPTPFITGLSGAEGAVTDPLTNDFLFSTFGGGNQVIEVRGFSPPQPAATAPALSHMVLVLLVVILAAAGIFRVRKVRA